MKASMIVLIALLGIGCAKKSDPAPCGTSVVLGSWSGSVGGQPDVLTFNADCSYTDSVCDGKGTYPNIPDNSGTVLITINTTNSGAFCLPAGKTSCAYSLTGNSLSYNCGGGVLTFTKQ